MPNSVALFALQKAQGGYPPPLAYGQFTPEDIFTK